MRKPLLAILFVLVAYYAWFETPRLAERRYRAALAGASTSEGPRPSAPPKEVAGALRLEPWLDGFDKPLCMAFAPGDPAKRLFIVEKTGRIRIVREGKVDPAPFLDIADKVSRGGEQGLLSVAFHPKHAANGLFYVNYTDRRGDTRVVEYRVKGLEGADRDAADPASAKQILFVDQPYENHNGGGMVFDREGRLWVGMGDGGARDDPKGAGQDDRALLGKMLRLDVDAPRGKDGAAPLEVRVKGVRNPWRFSFDRATGDLYIGDVGQDRFEEIDVLPGGGRGGENLGWSLMEGFHAAIPKIRAASPIPEGVTLTPPVVEYGREVGVSVTGGYVYRGAEVPEMQGAYLFADYASGAVRSLRWRDGKVEDYWEWRPVLDPRGRLASLASFGEDEAGELYLLSLDGPIRRFRSTRELR